VSRWENGELTTRRPLLLQNIKAGVSVSYFLKH